MKRTLKTVLGLIIGAGGVAGLIFAYSEMSKERQAEAEREKPVAAKSRLRLEANGEAILTLDAESQGRIGLQSEPIQAVQLRPEVKGYARVLEPSPLVALVAELASAQAAATASEKDFERVKRLKEQNNTSERVVQAAEAAAQRDRIAVEAIRLKLIAGWGTIITEQPDLERLAQTLASLQNVLVRVDLAADQTIKSAPIAATIVLSGAEAHPIPAQWLGPAPNVDPQMQGQGFLFLVKTNTQLAPGRAALADLQVDGEPQSGFLVPDAAVVRYGGRGWVFVQTGAENFTRREIALDHRLENGWFVNRAINEKDRLVVSGAQALLSEERKTEVKMAD